MMADDSFSRNTPKKTPHNKAESHKIPAIIIGQCTAEELTMLY